jgi:hypothetical protein
VSAGAPRSGGQSRATVDNPSFSWDRLTRAVRDDPGVVVGYTVAVAATLGFLALALSKPRSGDAESWTDGFPRQCDDVT